MSDRIELGQAEQSAAWRLIELALAEDLGFGDVSAEVEVAQAAHLWIQRQSQAGEPPAPRFELDRDLTCAALVDPAESATIDVVIRCDGVLAGAPIAELVFRRLDPSVRWQTLIADGSTVIPQAVVARVSGPLRSLLIGERTALNFLMHLSGVATQTRRYVIAVEGTRAVILDTRKTLPGWRLLEKYAVRCGGGTNHRLGLHDGVLIKDNHLAAWMEAAAKDQRSEASSQDSANSRPLLRSIAAAVRQARSSSPANMPIEVEVDTLEQLRDALDGGPEIVLLDNMNPPLLREAVRLRDELAPSVRLEASGGITLANVRLIAETGVDRISIGALTHSAAALDIAFDWNSTTENDA